MKVKLKRFEDPLQQQEADLYGDSLKKGGFTLVEEYSQHDINERGDDLEKAEVQQDVGQEDHNLNKADAQERVQGGGEAVEEIKGNEVHQPVIKQQENVAEDKEAPEADGNVPGEEDDN